MQYSLHRLQSSVLRYLIGLLNLTFTTERRIIRLLCALAYGPLRRIIGSETCTRRLDTALRLSLETAIYSVDYVYPHTDQI